MIARCIKTWRGTGTYYWGGGAAFKKNKEYPVISRVDISKDNVGYIVEDTKYGGYEYLYTNQEPYFSDYFIEI